MLGCRSILMLCLLGCLVTTSWSVSTTEKDWSSFTLTGNYNWFLYNVEPQLRLINADNPFNQFLINAGGGRQVLPFLELWLGQTMTTTSQDASDRSLEEYRTWEQAIMKFDILSAKLISRTRLEQRKSLDFPNWAGRIRERLMLTIPLTENMSLAIGDEVLLNTKRPDWITTGTWDQNRAYIGVVQQLSNNLFLNVGYMNQHIFTKPAQNDAVLVINVQLNLPT